MSILSCFVSFSFTKNTIREPFLGRVVSRVRYRARRSLLRSTAVLANALLTTAAAREMPEEGSTLAEIAPWRSVLPSLITSLTSLARRRRLVPNMDYTVTRARPLRRRRNTVLRPAVVAFLFKNPCARARLRFFGWYVTDIRKYYTTLGINTTCSCQT